MLRSVSTVPSVYTDRKTTLSIGFTNDRISYLFIVAVGAIHQSDSQIVATASQPQSLRIILLNNTNLLSYALRLYVMRVFLINVKLRAGCNPPILLGHKIKLIDRNRVLKQFQ